MKKIDYNTAGAYWTMFASVVGAICLIAFFPKFTAVAIGAPALAFGTPYVIMRVWNYFVTEDDNDGE